MHGVRGLGSEVRVASTFTMLAVCRQKEASRAGAAVGAGSVLARVLAQAARRHPAFVHICRGENEQQAQSGRSAGAGSEGAEARETRQEAGDSRGSQPREEGVACRQSSGGGPGQRAGGVQRGRLFVPRGSQTPVSLTNAGPAERIPLETRLAVTAVGSREVVAQLALATAMHTCLTLIHVCGAGKQDTLRSGWPQYRASWAER